MGAMKMSSGLTPKQTKFIQGMAAGKSGTQAALEAYDTDDPIVAGGIASDNLQKPYIRERVEEALKAAGLDLNSVASNLRGLASKEVDKVSGDTVLRANVEILKLLGAYPGSKHTQVSVSVKANLNGKSYGELKQEFESLNSINGEIIDDVEAND